jgi:hypothetical protein
MRPPLHILNEHPDGLSRISSVRNYDRSSRQTFNIDRTVAGNLSANSAQSITEYGLVELNAATVRISHLNLIR